MRVTMVSDDYLVRSDTGQGPSSLPNTQKSREAAKALGAIQVIL